MKTRFLSLSMLMFLSAAGLVAVTVIAQSQNLSGSALVAALRRGGYVIVMRHASSPRETPDKKSANADNVNLERQLDAAGRDGATAMGKAIRNLKIPIGEVQTSPTYRAIETVKYAQLGSPQPHAELGDRGQSMQGVSEADGAWLRERSALVPKMGNTIIVTHMPNVSRAFPEVSGMGDGEALIFRPDGKGAATLVSRVKIEEWSALKP